jgi:tRNA isopentenyl-2-thiomethyl-A-37 hydroxylase MiaE
MFSVNIVHFDSYTDNSSCLSGVLHCLLCTEAWVVGTTKNRSNIMLHDFSLTELSTMKMHIIFENQYDIH